MALTDYIPDTVLESEGYVHKSCKEQMLANLDAEFLADRGWVNIDRQREVEVSIKKAAEIIGITPITLEGYIKLGYLRKTANGKILLIAALSFDYNEAKRRYLNSKHLTNGQAVI